MEYLIKVLFIGATAFCMVTVLNIFNQQFESEYLNENKSNIIIKKGSMLVQNKDGSFKIIKGCFIKYDNNTKKEIERCV